MDLSSLLALSSGLLLIIGIALIAIEIFLYSFVIVWLGFGFVFVAVIHYFYPLSSLWLQLIIVSIIAVVLFLLLNKKLRQVVNKKNIVKDDFMEQGGQGTIKNNMLSYRGSYLTVVNLDISALDGQLVRVDKIEKNDAWISLITR